MANFDTEYPFPVLRAAPVDYKSSTFEAEVSVTPDKKGYIFHTKLIINNNEVRKLVETGIAKPGIYIQCNSTWVRRIEIVKLDEDEFIVPSSDVRGRVSFCPFITADATIENFHSGDFTEEYEDIKIVIHPGDPLAVGEEKYFDAVYVEDLFNKGDSIISVGSSPKATAMTFDFEKDFITVIVPPKWYDAYTSMKITKEKYPLLGALFYLPAVTEGVRLLSPDGENDPDFTWARTLKSSIMRLAGKNNNKYKKLLEDPFWTAQQLIEGMDDAVLSLASWVIEKGEA